jgi:glucokinase
MYSIGIDLGGTNIAGAVVDSQGDIVFKASIPTRRERHWEEIVDDIAQLVKSLVKDYGLHMRKIQAVGVGCPGIIDPQKGRVVFASNLAFEDTPIRDRLQKKIKCPIYIENDANAAAYGEYVAGIGKDYDSFVAITIGTGIGSGIVIDNIIFSGAYHGGAELGHTVIRADGRPCPCGRRGCWDIYSSATALIHEAKQVVKKYPESLIYEFSGNNIEHIRPEMVFKAYHQKDPYAYEIIKGYIHNLAIGLVNVINTFQPEAIALGGGISNQKETLLQLINKEIYSEIGKAASSMQTKLEICQLGNDAGIIGAGMLYKLRE